MTESRDRDRPRPPWGHPHLHPRFEALRDAAIQAELDTGVREDTVEEARAHVLRRLGRMTLGGLVVVIGIILMPLPGPGILIVAGGLAILARDFEWAERTLAIVRRRLPQDESGRLPRRAWFVLGASVAVAVSFSVWWSLLR